MIVDPKDGKIPYLPAAAQRKKDLVAHHMYDDPEAHCFLSGIPRQVYAPFGFQILQPANYVLFLFENFHAYRVIPTDGRPHLPADIKQFEGDSRGRWEGDTLVVDVTNQNDKTWFDMAGNFHSDAVHVIERYTPVDANTIAYEATIEDPKTFSAALEDRVPDHAHHAPRLRNHGAGLRGRRTRSEALHRRRRRREQDPSLANPGEPTASPTTCALACCCC